MNKRLAIIAQKAAKEAKETCMLDAYNNSFCTDVSVTITTRVYACNHYWIMEQGEINETQIPPVPNSQFSILNSQFPKMLNVITLFSGYDSQCLALNRLGLPYDLVAWAEIDKHACTAHDALFPQFKGRNVGDVSKVDWAEWHKQHPQPIDLLTYSSPCQDFSSAGLQRGGEEGSGTRSGLLWETERAVRELRPRHLVFENVGGLVSDKFIDLFQRWQVRLNGYGYTNFAQLMNAKDYGVPQNRLRIFMVSVLDCPRAYYFPKPFKLERRLKDVLEQNVAERYYLKDSQIESLLRFNEDRKSRGMGFQWKPKTEDDVAGAVCTMAGQRQTDNYIAEPQMLGWTRNEKGEITDRHPVSVANCVTAAKRDNTQNYVMEPTIAAMRGRDKDNPNDRGKSTDNYTQRLELKPDGTSNTITSVAKDNLLIEPRCQQIGNIHEGESNPQSGRVYSSEGISPTLDCCQGGNREPKITEGIRIRRLTERELYRLMDVDEKDIDTLLAAPIPRTQHAKLAGNSIVVACLYYIFRNLFVDTEPAAGTQTKLF